MGMNSFKPSLDAIPADELMGGSGENTALLQVRTERLESLELHRVEPERQRRLDVQGAIVDEDRVLPVARGDPEGAQVDPLIGLGLPKVTRDEETLEDHIELERPYPMLVQLLRF